MKQHHNGAIFTAEMKNQPDDNCFACKRASSSPRALYPARQEHREAPSSPHFLRGSRSLWILFYGLELNQFFVFSSFGALMEGQYLLHLGSTGYIKIWEGSLSIVMYQLESTACTMQRITVYNWSVQSEPMGSWHEAQHLCCHSCFTGAYLCFYTWQPRKAMQTQQSLDRCPRVNNTKEACQHFLVCSTTSETK